MNRIELEDRLVTFAIAIDDFCITEYALKSRIHLSDQIRRSSTSVALNYAEAQSAGSTRDYIHKITIVLKEIRETEVCLKIIKGISGSRNITPLLTEADELLRIFYSSRETARRRKATIL